MLNKTKVKYIWITDFKRYTLDLEEPEKTGNPKPNLFDYMSVNKQNSLDNKQDTHLLYKGSQRVKGIIHNNLSILQRNNTCVPDNIRDMLDNAI